ncbi:hypothetical protein SEEK9263_22898, partial [Salmonella enterica subsp. enterica serovar Kentucky str. ATCC 9263]
MALRLSGLKLNLQAVKRSRRDSAIFAIGYSYSL